MGKTNVGRPAVTDRRPSWWRTAVLLGPAFVASIAYVDPGNVAANLTAGAQYGYLLVWVLVLANAMAVLIQYQSAKLGIVTGKSLPQLIGERARPWTRRAYWVQAELVAAATDIAEVIGGAVALHMLFNVPLVIGGLIVGAVSHAILLVQTSRRQRTFEVIIVGFLTVIAFGFLAGLFVSQVDWAQAAGGLVPRFEGTSTVLLAASMLGATVMPHAIYLHSALARDRHRATGIDFATAPALETAPESALTRRLLRATRGDVIAALIIAGAVNISMLLLAAASLRGVEGTDTIEGAHAAVVASLGPVIGVIFAVGLLASGLASTSVGAYAGAVIMGGLLKVQVPVLVRRLVTLIPALLVLAAGIEPTLALVLSQVVLSLVIPFALVPLIRLTGNRALMGGYVDRLPIKLAAWVVVGLIVTLNAVLIVLTATGV